MGAGIARRGLDISGLLGPRSFAWGAEYPLTYVSDSGDQTDLDQVGVREILVVQPGATGAAATLVANLWSMGWRDATNTGDSDLHSANAGPYPGLTRARAAARIQLEITNRGSGSATVQQYFQQYDNRTGVPAASPVLVPESGFSFTFVAERVGGNDFIRVTKRALGNHGVEPGRVANTNQISAQVP